MFCYVIFFENISVVISMNRLNLHNFSLREYLEQDESLLDSKVLAEMTDLNLIDDVLRQYLTINDMRDAGSFFTGFELANAAIDCFSSEITHSSIVLDPTCGAGNLLLACSRKLDIHPTLSETLSKWGKVLWGIDIHESFVEATKLRIIIEALHRGAIRDCSIVEATNLLSNIFCSDAMKVEAVELEKVTHVLMNPPFTEWPSPRMNYWKAGKVNAAGVLADKYMRILPDMCEISMILPEVLRSGSRYGGFRTFMDSTFNANTKVWGRFNSKTNVDVFLLFGKKESDSSNTITWHQRLDNYVKLSEHYDVRTGPLVAYRDPEIGEEYPYFHPKNCCTWGRINDSDVIETRRFKGTVLEPPFVVVKRTSSPFDKHRAAATIINVKGKVAVENHMIVITPKSGKISDCSRLIKVMKSEKTNDFLNDRARMRHLTVGVIKDIPIE